MGRDMEKGGWTEGPWWIVGEDFGVDQIPYIEVSAGEMGTHSYESVAYVQPAFVEDDEISDDEWVINAEVEANATLIAAAPDLFKALELAHAIICNMISVGAVYTPIGDEEAPSGSYYIANGVMPKLADALRQARGQS
jgi:hypothetical protein